MNDTGQSVPVELTSKRHWEEAWAVSPRLRLPSSLIIGTKNMQRVLRTEVRPGMRVLEVGCAPGKILAWVAVDRGADVAGLDYSDRGIAWARRLFEALSISADLRCEDLLATTFPAASFDVVYSFGLVEHFEDPEPIVRAHVALSKPGGKVVIGVPHYGGIYGRLQRWFDPDNLAIHNVDIMSVDALTRLAPRDLASRVRAYEAGRLSPWLVSFERRLPRSVARPFAYGLNGIGLIQPMDIRALCPLLVLEITRAAESPC